MTQYNPYMTHYAQHIQKTESELFKMTISYRDKLIQKLNFKHKLREQS